VPQVEPFADSLVPLGQGVDRFELGLVVDAAEGEVDHDVIRLGMCKILARRIPCFPSTTIQ
jgi:hypothetical protein